MRAFVTRKTNDGRREKRMVFDANPPSAPGFGEAAVETMFTGLTNGTERNDLIGGNYSTPDEKLPAGMGYQNVGKVIEIGLGVTNVSVGDIVFSGTWLTSDHAERVTVPVQNCQRFAAFIKVPDGVKPSDAALFGVASVAVRACAAAAIQKGDRVLIVGLGVLGQIAAQVANDMGGVVTACDVNPERLAMARSIGAAGQILDTSGDGWKNQIHSESFDKVMDFAGVKGMEDKFLDAVRVGGTAAFIAGRQRVDYEFNLGQFKEITIRQIAHFDNADLERVAQMVAAGTVRIEPLIDKVVPAGECGEIYDLLRDAPDKLLGCVFDWRS